MLLQTTTRFSPFQNLANELLSSILNYLERSSIINISHVSHRLRTAASAHEDYYFFAQLVGPINNSDEFSKRYMVFLKHWAALGDRPRLLKVRLFAYSHTEAPSIADIAGPINEFCAAIAAGYVVRLQLDLQAIPGRNDLLSQLSVTPAPALRSVRLIMHGKLLPDIAFANDFPRLRHVSIVNGHWSEVGTQHVDRPPQLNPLFRNMRFVQLEGVYLHSLRNIGRYFPSAENVHIGLLHDVLPTPDVSTWRVWPFPASARKITVDVTWPWMNARCTVDEGTVMNRLLEIFGHVVPRITSGRRTTVSIAWLDEGMHAKAGKAMSAFIKASAANDPLHVEVKIYQEISSHRISPPYAILRIGSTSVPVHGTIVIAKLVGNSYDNLWDSVVEKLIDLGQRLESLDAPTEFHTWLRGDARKLMRVLKAVPSLRTQFVVGWNECQLKESSKLPA